MGTSVSRAAMAHVRTIFAALAALALTLTFAPSALFADDSVAGPLAGPGYENDARSASPNPASESPQPTAASQGGEGSNATPTLASTLAGSTASIVSADVMLDASDPVIGSFTVDGLTYALNDGKATLISVGATFVVAPYEGSADSGDGNAIAIPSSVTYNGTTYAVTAIGPYAFYLSGATDVALPDSIVSVDDRVFCSSDVARVEVDPANPNIASYEGALYSADLTSLLLIPEGRAGAVLLPKQAEVVEASKFSHCSLVDAISVEEGGADFASWDGLLYDASGTTLLRVPAGATEITIRDGCTTIAAGALEGCAKLERIYAPASVTSISPDVFASIPTVSLPAQMAVQDESDGSAQVEDEAEVSPRRVVASSQGLEAPLALPDLGSTSASPSSEASGSAPQLTAMVALSSADDDLPEVDPSSIEVVLPEGANAASWRAVGFSAVARSDGEEGEGASDEAVSVAQALSYEAASALSGTGSVTVVGPHWRNGGGISALPTTRVSSSTTYSGTFGACGGVYVWPTGVTSATFYVHVSSTNNTYCVSDAANKVGYPIFYCYDCDRIIDCRYKAINPNHTHNDYESGTHGSFSFDWSTYYCWIPSGGKWDGLDGEQATKAKRTPTSNIRGSMTVSATPDGSLPTRAGYKLVGWNTEEDGSGQGYGVGATVNSSIPLNLYAQWERVDFDIGFDVDSEPGDADYPGEAKDDQTVNKDDGQVPIEDPKRPGYVFEGWVIPTEDGTEAVDQDLVYQGDDGKWYVDASKLPDYAGDDGRVELTARWTSVISVDVPSSVTFYADLVTQGQESREGAASGGESNGAFGQNQVSNQSQVDLRVVGLESSAVKTTDTTLGADSVLKKADAATPSTSSQKLLSLYPSTKQWTADELQDPDAVGGDKATTAVDFDLDDILLEKSFKADDFTIAAGGTLNMGYRLNLSETGQQLDYDKLSTLSEGQSASIANVSYTFAADYGMSFWTLDDDGSTLNVFAIKADAEKIAAGDAAIAAKYTAWMNADHRFYVKWYDQGVAETDDPTKATVYDVRIIGLNHDDKSDGSGKAGITFQFVNCLADEYAMDSRRTNAGGWGGAELRAFMSEGGSIYQQAPNALQDALATVSKRNWKGASPTQDQLFLPAYSEMATTFSSGWLRYISAETLSQEGNLYAWYKSLNVNGNYNCLQLLRTLSDTGTRADLWWGRTPSPTHSFTFLSTYNQDSTILGRMGGTTDSQNHGGVSPAFCL